MNLSRRNALKLGLGAAALWATGVRPATLLADADKPKKIPIGLQLYSVRDVAGKDVPSTLERVAELGYQGVEFAGYYDLSAEELRKLLDQNGLKCCGTHLHLSALAEDALRGTVEFNKILGNEFLIVSSLSRNRMDSLASLIDTAKLFTDLAEELRDSGMRIGYHAHGQDFEPVADRIPWEVIFANAGPNVVMQLDTGNCLAGGGDPIAVLKAFPHRSATIHLKEHGGLEGAVIGEGDVPWREVFQLCETTGDTQWYIVEQETYRGSSFGSVELCLANLHKMGK